MKGVGDVTRLLIRWSSGDHSAADELMPVVYSELRRLALGHSVKRVPIHLSKPPRSSMKPTCAWWIRM